MSRTRKGSKPVGFEYWGKMKGGSMVDRKTSTKMQRMEYKEQDRDSLKDALFEIGEGVWHCDSDPYMRNLFPEAKTLEVYHHHILGYDVLLVDGKFFGQMSGIDELLAFSYHCGVSFNNYEDLSDKYEEYLDENEPYDFLP